MKLKNNRKITLIPPETMGFRLPQLLIYSETIISYGNARFGRTYMLIDKTVSQPPQQSTIQQSTMADTSGLFEDLIKEKLEQAQLGKQIEALQTAAEQLRGEANSRPGVAETNGVVVRPARFGIGSKPLTHIAMVGDFTVRQGKGR